MGVYLYCVLAHDAPAPASTGIDGADVRAVHHASVAVWCSDLDAPPAPSLNAVKRHHAVVASALATGSTPVPIRFGQWLEDETALRRHLDDHDYRGALRRVADAVEFGLRVVDPDAPGDAAGAGSGRPSARTDPDASATDAEERAPGPGTAYMRGLAERIHVSENASDRSLHAARRLDDALGAWVLERRIGPAEHPTGAAVAHLVQAGDSDRYAARARELAGTFPPLRIMVTGPWPPYSFVS